MHRFVVLLIAGSLVTACAGSGVEEQAKRDAGKDFTTTVLYPDGHDDADPASGLDDTSSVAVAADTPLSSTVEAAAIGNGLAASVDAVPSPPGTELESPDIAIDEPGADTNVAGSTRPIASRAGRTGTTTVPPQNGAGVPVTDPLASSQPATTSPAPATTPPATTPPATSAPAWTLVDCVRLDPTTGTPAGPSC